MRYHESMIVIPAHDLMGYTCRDSIFIVTRLLRVGDMGASDAVVAVAVTPSPPPPSPPMVVVVAVAEVVVVIVVVAAATIAAAVVVVVMAYTSSMKCTRVITSSNVLSLPKDALTAPVGPPCTPM
jgi:hypothetical protein